MNAAFLALAALCAQVLEWDLQTSMTYVNSIYHSAEGMWCATSGGMILCDADGDFGETITFPDELPHFKVNDVMVDPGGRLWAATADGLACRENGEWTVYTAFEGIPGESVWDVEAVGEWVFAASDGGLARWSGGTDFVPLDESTTGGGFDAGEVTGMAELSDTLWLATEDGVFSLDLSASPYDSSSWRSWSDATHELGMTDLVTSGDSLFGYGENGVFKRQDNRWTTILDYFSPDSLVFDLIDTPEGLVAAARGVRRRVSGRQWEPLGTGFPSQTWATALGWDGTRVWAGVGSCDNLPDDFGRGLAVLQEGSWQVRDIPGQPSRSCYQISMNDGIMYLGSHNRGLLAGYEEGWRSYEQPQGMPNILRTYSAVPCESGGMWTASYHYGLTWYDDSGTWLLDDDSTVTFVAESLPGVPPGFPQVLAPLFNNQVVSVSSQAGCVWIGQEAFWSSPDEPSGLVAVTGSPRTGDLDWQTWDFSDGLAVKNIRTVQALGQDMVWIAFGSEQGCQMLDYNGTPTDKADDTWLPGPGEAFTTASGLPVNQVYCFALEPSGSVLIGTGDGLCRWTRAAGIRAIAGPSDAVKALVIDGLQRIWCLGTTAIYCVEGNLVTSFDDGNSPYYPSSRVESEYSAWIPSQGRVLFSSPVGMWSLEVQGGGGSAGQGIGFYPQPFLPAAGEPLRMTGLEDGPVSADFYSLDGRFLGTVGSDDPENWEWSGDFDGSPAATGIYLVVVETPGGIRRARLAVVR